MAATTKTFLNNNLPTLDDVDLNGIKSESNNLIAGSGQSLNTSDNEQTHKAVSHYSSVGDFYVESGLADAYVINPVSPRTSVLALEDGMRFRFNPLNDNTGASTIDIAGISTIDIKMIDGSDPVDGDIKSGQINVVEYLSGFAVLKKDVDLRFLLSVAEMVSLEIAAGQYIETRGYYGPETGGAAKYLVKTSAQATADGDIIDEYGNHTLANGNVAILQLESSTLNALQFGARGDNGTTDNTIPTKKAIIFARKIYVDADDLTNITILFPDQPDAYYHSSGIPLVTGVYLKCESRHSVSFITDGTDASVYTATESGGVFTDNLDQPVNVNTAENCGIINIRFDHEGTISGVAPESGVEFEGAIHIQNAPGIELFNLRVSCKTSYKDGIWIKNSFRFNMYRPYVSRNSGFIGGHGIYVESISNAGSLYQPFVFGNFSRGIKVSNPDTVTLWEPNVEQAWVDLDINADNPKVYGGYVEGAKISEIDVGWGSATVCFEWLVDHIWMNGNGQLSLVNEDFRWVLSASGASEYYLQRASGSLDPQVPNPWTIEENGTPMTLGSVGSLTAGTWDYGDNDGLGYDVPYVRLADSTDPDSKADDWLETGVYGIRLGNCVGGEVKHPHFEGSFTKRFASESGANGNKANEIKLQRGDASNPDLSGYGLDDGRNIVKIISQDYSDYRQYKEWSTETLEYIQTELNQRGAQFCMFYVWIRNNGGTLEARVTDGDGAATTYDQCFQSLSSTYVTCSTPVSAGVDFGGSGVGILSGVASIVLLNVNQQTVSEQACICGPVVTDNGDQIAIVPRVANRDINGNDIYRVELQFRNQVNDTSYDINTTNLAAGESLRFPIMGFIK